jgi:hypothetical protein
VGRVAKQGTTIALMLHDCAALREVNNSSPSTDVRINLCVFPSI